MTDNSRDELDGMTALCEVFADAFTDASEAELDQALVAVDLSVAGTVAETTRTIESALNSSLKRKLIAAGQAARAQVSDVRPDLSSLSREELVAKLRLITANEDNAGETLTMAARAGRDSMGVDELRSLIEDFYAIQSSSGDD